MQTSTECFVSFFFQKRKKKKGRTLYSLTTSWKFSERNSAIETKMGEKEKKMNERKKERGKAERYYCKEKELLRNCCVERSSMLSVLMMHTP